MSEKIGGVSFFVSDKHFTIIYISSSSQYNHDQWQITMINDQWPMIMMIVMLTDLGFLGQAGGAREWNRSCGKRDQPQAVKVAIILKTDHRDLHHHDYYYRNINIMMMMNIYQVRSREADLVQGSEFGHHGLFSNLSPFHLLLLLPSFPHSDYYAQTPMVSRLQMMLNVSPRELIMSPGENLPQ